MRLPFVEANRNGTLHVNPRKSTQEPFYLKYLETKVRIVGAFFLIEKYFSQDSQLQKTLLGGSMTTTKDQKVWRDTNSKILDWFRQNNLNEAEHRLDNCCETEDDVLEWKIERDGIALFITLLRNNTEVVLQMYSTLGYPLNISDNHSLLDKLLRLNATDLSYCAFALEEDNSLILIADHPARSLDVNCINLLIDNLRTTAQRYKSILSEQPATEP